MPLRRSITTATLAIALFAANVALPGGPAAGAAPSPPQTRITFGPAGPTNLREPTFAWESNDPEARFECRLDSAPFEPCNLVEEEALEPGGKPLSEGPHTFEVRAVNLAGIADPTPARVHLIVDAEGPSVNVRKGALGLTRHRRPIFRFTVSGGGHTLCALYGITQVFGGHTWGSPHFHHCTGPGFFQPQRPLPDGEYLFAVKAFDHAENFGEASRVFTVRGPKSGRRR
jgi:hypothetical protein